MQAPLYGVFQALIVVRQRSRHILRGSANCLVPKLNRSHQGRKLRDPSQDYNCHRLCCG